MQNEENGFDSWALVELMGHQRITGRVTEAQIGGCKFVRVDVPESEGKQPLTKYLGPSSIYGITPLDEKTARALAKQLSPEPISKWEASRLLEPQQPAPKTLPGSTADDEDEAEDDFEDEQHF